MGLFDLLFGPRRPAWQATYQKIKDLGSALVHELPTADEHYEVLRPRVDVVFCGRDVNGAIDRYNSEHGTTIAHNPRNHTFIWCSGPAAVKPLEGKYSPLCKYVVFLVGDDQFWDRVGLADEVGHLLMGERSHWMGE
ncbi:MAG: hypothetical protein KQI62_02300 [Deltaproteobacteria bacterium]|nr:hypothetical protein [Deltaproteobacteria bacterium]